MKWIESNLALEPKWLRIVAITKILVVHVWISCSLSVVLHAPSPYNHCALARKESLGGLLTQAVVWGGLRHPREAREFGAAQASNADAARDKYTGPLNIEPVPDITTLTRLYK